MKKTVSLILLVCMILSSQLCCGALSYFEGIDTVQVIGKQSEITREEMLQKVVEDAKEYVKENPDVVFTVMPTGSFKDVIKIETSVDKNDAFLKESSRIKSALISLF